MSSRKNQSLSKQNFILISIIGVLLVDGLYEGTNWLILHSDSFVLHTIITLGLAYVFIFLVLRVMNKKAPK